MEDKRPIDRKRESAGTADIGTREDGAILEMTKIGKRLIVIKENAIYEFMMADDIDPKRTNIKLPNNIHQLILDKGAESEMVSKVFLTAKTLFNKGAFSEDTDITKALTLSLEILQEMSILEKEINDYQQKEEEVRNEYEAKRDKPVSYSIPAIGDVQTRCTTIFQKADHIEQILMEIITVFYPNEKLTKQSHFPKFYEVLKNKYGKDNRFTKFVKSTLEFMKLIRAFRNALDHRLDAIRVYDFELQPNSDVLTPTIELDHKDSKWPRQSVSESLNMILPNFIYVFEMTIAYMCDHTSTPSLMSQAVKEIPEDKRRYKHVRFSFWSPMGEGGYYNQ
ncbi:MAG: hypothetical protein AAF901_14620 [Bacteroidota bacterium]